MSVRWTGLLAALIVAAGCSSEPRSSSGASTTPSATTTFAELDMAPATSTTVDTTLPVDTTRATDPPASTTTVAPGIVLRGNGLQFANFGDNDTAVLAEVTPLAGAPVSDTPNRFPNDDGAGTWSNDGQSFVAPYARTVCFSGSLCLFFGETAATELRLVGWSYGGGSGLRTLEGFTVGDTLERFSGAVTIPTGGCYSSSDAPSTDGVHVSLLSTGEPFLSYPPDGGDAIIGHPALSDLQVTSLDAGALIYETEGDC